jgi:hypothetical protein
MGWGAALDTVIGVVLMYVVLSLVCTVINEYISTWLSLRSKTLKDSLQRLLDVPVLHADFLNHGLIGGASSASGEKPSSYLAGRDFAMALFGALDPTKPFPGFADVKQAVADLPDSNIRDALLAQITTTDGTIEQLRDNVATWFDGTMDRLGGVYKRQLKLISFLVGIGVALILNADTVSVARALWSDEGLRAQMVNVAQSIQQDPKIVAAVASAGSQANTQAPAGASASNQPAPNAASGTDQSTGRPPVKTSDVLQALHDAQNTLRPLPLGWSYAPPQTPLDVLSKIIGIVLTGFALSLGAPFWFDLLSKFMNIRGTGPKPEPTAQSASSAS